MDHVRFDALARAAASGGLPRRRLLTRLGAGGLGAALLGLGGRGAGRAAPAVTQQVTCSLSVVAAVRLGPSAGALLVGTTPGELRGDLEFTIGELGAISEGTLRLEDGAELPVVGQATGRALHLRVRLEDDEALVLVGTAENDLGSCDGPVGGLLTGPEPGDLGDWRATLSAASAAPGAGSTSGSSPSSGSAGCPPGQLLCGGACVDATSDPNNCGACGVVCGIGTNCAAGTCAPAPPPDSI